MAIVSPSLIIGLGDRGVEIAGAVSAYITENNRDLARLHSGFGIEDSGNVRNLGPGEGSFFCVDQLESTIRPEVWADNYNRFVDYEKQFCDLLEKYAQEVNHPGLIQELEDGGVRVNRDFNLFIFSSISHAVGSAVLLPSLAFVEKTLRPMVNPRINVVLLNPNLFAESEQDVDHLIRSYCCVAEMDWALENPGELLGENSFILNNIWMLEKGNERNDFLSSYEELLPMISETILLVLSKAVLLDNVIDAMYNQTIEGRPAQYSSFGLKKLVFPVDKLMRAIKSYIQYNLLEIKGALNPGSIDMGRAYADVHKLLCANSIDRIHNLILEKEDGTEIWRDFAYSGRTDESTEVNDFIERLDEQYQQFANRDMQSFNELISQRRDGMLEEFKKLIINKVSERIDNDEKLGVSYAEGFLAAMYNSGSNVFRGDAPDEPLTINNVKANIYEYFYKELHLNDIVKRLVELKEELKEATLERERLQTGDVVVDKTGPLAGGEEDSTEGEGEPDRATVVKREIERIEKEIGNLEKRLNQGDEVIKDQDLCRQKIVKDGEERFQADYEANSCKLREVDDNLRKAKNDREALDDKRVDFVKKCFVLAPIGLVALVCVLAVVVPFVVDFVSFVGSVKIFGVALVLLLAAYFIRYGRIYSRKYTAPLKNLDQRIQADQLTRKNLMIGLKDIKNVIMRRRFDYYRFKKLLEWYHDALNHVESLRSGLKDFASLVSQYAQAARDEWENLDFPNTLFVRHVIRREDAARYVTKYSSLDIEMQQFFGDKKYSGYFRDYWKERNIDGLDRAFEDFTENGYEFIRKMTVEDAIDEKGVVDTDDINHLIQNFFESIQSFTRISFGDNMDQSENVIYIGVPDVNSSSFSDILNNLGYGNHIRLYPFQTPTEIVGLKLKVGFPSFYITELQKAHNQYMRAENRAAYSCCSDWQVGSIVPANMIFDNEDDEYRRAALICRALGIIGKGESGYMFGNELIGGDFKELVDLLKTVKGAKIHRRLKDAIDSSRYSFGATVDKINSFVEANKLDVADKNILNDFIAELDPLA